MGLSHNLTLCFASLLSVSPLYPLLFFFFFYLGFFAFSVTPFGAECFVFFVCLFFFNRLLGSWAPRLGGSWVLDWPDDGLGAFMIFWEGARAKN